MERYEKYKNSGVEWIEEVPEHWEVKRLKYVISNKLKYGANETAEQEDKSNPRYIRITDFDSEGKLRNDTFKSLVPEKAKDFLLEEGDVLFARSGATVGKTFQFKNYQGEACFAGYLIKASPNERIMLSDFLYLYTRSGLYENWKNSIFNQATIENIGADKYAFLEIPVPPLEEQRTIILYLNNKTAEIDQLIADKKRLITLYEEEKTALINQAVTKGINPDVKMKDSGIEWLGEVPEEWEVKKLKYILQSIVGGGTPSTTNSLYWDGDIPWVSAKDMKQDLIFSTQDFITELAVKESSTSFIPDERVLIVVRSGILKHTLPVAINKVPVCINQDLKALKPIPQISTDYFFWKLKGMSKDILTFCNKMGATVDSIELTDLMNFPFSFPDIQEQHVIVNHIKMGLNLINDKLQKHQNLIDLLTEYRTALISEVVTGKIKVV